MSELLIAPAVVGKEDEVAGVEAAGTGMGHSEAATVAGRHMRM
jgi:hypothetical protein